MWFVAVDLVGALAGSSVALSRDLPLEEGWRRVATVCGRVGREPRRPACDGPKWPQRMRRTGRRGRGITRPARSESAGRPGTPPAEGFARADARRIKGSAAHPDSGQGQKQSGPLMRALPKFSREDRYPDGPRPACGGLGARIRPRAVPEGSRPRCANKCLPSAASRNPMHSTHS